MPRDHPLHIPHVNLLLCIGTAVNSLLGALGLDFYREESARSHLFDAVHVLEDVLLTVTYLNHPERVSLFSLRVQVHLRVAFSLELASQEESLVERRVGP